MRVDLNRMAATAIDAALDDGKPRRRRFSGMRAVVAGAALVGVARVAIKRAPSLPHLPGLPDLADLRDRVEDRLADAGWLGYEDEPVDEEQEEPVDEGEELEDEELEDDDDEYDDEPTAEEPVDEAEAEPEDEAEDEPEDEAEEELEDDARESPGVEVAGNGRAQVDPAAMPPEPPARRSRKKATSGSK
jgi:hypothetical protein